MKLKLYSIFLFLFFSIPTYAVDISAYQADVPVTSYSESDLKKALSSALEQVLVHVSASGQVTKNPAVVKAVSNPSLLVQMYHYLPGATDADLKLQVQFYQKAIDQLLQTSAESAASKESSEEDSKAVVEAASAEVYAITMIIIDIKTLNDYTSVLNYLRHVEGVKSVENQQTRGNRILLVLNSTQSAEALNQTIVAQSQLVKTTVQGVLDPAILVYRWVGKASVASVVETAPVDKQVAGVKPESGQAESFPVPQEGAEF